MCGLGHFRVEAFHCQCLTVRLSLPSIGDQGSAWCHGGVVTLKHDNLAPQGDQLSAEARDHKGTCPFLSMQVHSSTRLLGLPSPLRLLASGVSGRRGPHDCLDSASFQWILVAMEMRMAPLERLIGALYTVESLGHFSCLLQQQLTRTLQLSGRVWATHLRVSALRGHEEK